MTATDYETTDLQTSRARYYVWLITRDHLSPQGEVRYDFWSNKFKAAVYTGDLRKPYMGPGKMHAEERTKKTTGLSLASKNA